MKIQNPLRPIILIVILTTMYSCIQFKQASLYDGVEAPEKIEKPKSISLLVEPKIYDDDISDVWGLEKNECQVASVADSISFTGDRSLDVKWNRGAEDCDFAGIGIGWDSYAGKDLSELSIRIKSFPVPWYFSAAARSQTTCGPKSAFKALSSKQKSR